VNSRRPDQQPVSWRAEFQPQPRVNWWLRMTSVGPDTAGMTLEQRELGRRSRLLSWIILGLFVVDLLLLPLANGAPGTLAAIIVVFLGLAAAALLNRYGFVTIAGVFIVMLICGGVLASLATEVNGQLTMFDMPGYDIFALAVVVAASVLPRISAFIVAIATSVIIGVDFNVQGHAPDLVANIQSQGVVALLARPIALQIIIAVVAYLWVRGTDIAIRRADRAEEIAAMEHAIADQKRQLDIGVQQILETHVRVANGDFTARAPMNQENVLWQIAASLNNLLTRLQRSGQAEYQLRRTDEELRRLALAIRDAQAGRHPIWPAPAGTSADLIIELIGRGTRDPSRPKLPPMNMQASTSMHSSMRSPMPPFMQPPGQPPVPPSQPAMPMPPWEQWQSGPIPPTGPQLSTSPPREDMRQGGPSNPWVFPPEGEE
jgi:hypothetical protein